MEYFLGSIITIAIIIATRLAFKNRQVELPQTVRYSQSHIYKLIEPFMPTNREMTPPTITQSSKFLEKLLLRVVFVDQEAYWIKEGTFYVAQVENREIKHETATPVDTMSMDKIQLDKIKMVVERLTEGNVNDSRDAR